MNAARPPGFAPMVTAFTIWGVHFLVCWAAVEVWPDRWAANVVAWVATAIALAAIGLHVVRLRARQASGALPGTSARIAHGAIVLATVAILFSALPSIVFLP